jgi:hypothetical protein
LRQGRPDALTAYADAGRLHPCADGDGALDAVFAHWTAARAHGQDALMLARTRRDVDGLNARARAAALAAGQLTGPVTVVGGRAWQTGDVLRTRRNDRRLAVGDGHVRNGDRFQVLGPGPQNDLIVQDLTGRGRTVLPATYLAQHAEYGWASTIDAAQGATADVGIVLVRPGMDREHLYVAMTRGRSGNHAYITPDPTIDADHHGHVGTPPRPDLGGIGQEQALRVLQAALARSCAQDAAHTALEHARAVAGRTPRHDASHAARVAATAPDRRWESRPLPAEHGQAAQELTQRRAEQDQLRADRAALTRTLRQSVAELEALPRWALRRRRAVADTLSRGQQRLQQSLLEQASLDVDVDVLTHQVTQQARERLNSDLAPLQYGTRADGRPVPRPVEPGWSWRASERRADVLAGAGSHLSRAEPGRDLEDESSADFGSDLVALACALLFCHLPPVSMWMDATAAAPGKTRRHCATRSRPRPHEGLRAQGGGRPSRPVGSTDQRGHRQFRRATWRSEISCCSPSTKPPTASAPPPGSSGDCGPNAGSPSSSSASTSASTATTSTPTSAPVARNPTSVDATRLPPDRTCPSTSCEAPDRGEFNGATVRPNR